MAYFYLFLAVISLLYYITLSVYVNLSVSFSWIWLFSAVFFGLLAAGLMLEKMKKLRIPGGLRWTVRGFLAVIILIFLCTESAIVIKAVQKPHKQADYLIVLGAKVKGKKPSKMLRYRLEAALGYLEENPDTMAILSGGQGSDEEISEAQCMADYLLEHGISSDRLVLEDTSTSTEENLANSRQYLDSMDAQAVICSNDFHICRSLHIAKKAGYKQVSPLAAKSDWIQAPHFYVREFFAVVKEACH